MMNSLSKPGAHPIYAIVENVRSLFNVGAIFRSADGVNASGIYLTGFTGCPPRREISRVALGAEDSVPWRYERETETAIDNLRAEGVQVVALEQTPDSIDFRAFPYRYPVAVILGHEVMGVRPETLRLCDGVVHIPMLGHKASLNVSVAAGIALYELLSVFEGRETGEGRRETEDGRRKTEDGVSHKSHERGTTGDCQFKTQKGDAPCSVKDTRRKTEEVRGEKQSQS